MKKRIMATVVKSFAIQGIEGHNVDIQKYWMASL